jgi:hypothetical protein
MRSGVHAWDDDRVGLVWFKDDESNPEGDSREIHYAVTDWVDLLDDAASLVLADGIDTPCPFCDTGWEIDGSFDDRFSETDIARAMVSLLKPCSEHLDVGSEEENEVVFADRLWRWDNEQWVATG